MPQQDYVKASRPPPRPRNKAQPKPKRPVVLMIAVALLLILFGYFLWHISHRPGAEELAEQAKTVAVESSQEELPPKPGKEPYSYIEELENKEIKVEATELAQKAPATLICGTFKALEGAQQLKAQIAFGGLTAEIREVSAKYRVVVGPYQSKRQAQSDKNKLLRQKIANCWVAG